MRCGTGKVTRVLVVVRSVRLVGASQAACSSASLATASAGSGSELVKLSACRTTPSGSMMITERFTMPAVSLKIPSDWATPPLGQKSASNGCRMPPMETDQAFSDGAESTLIPMSAAPASAN